MGEMVLGRAAATIGWPGLATSLVLIGLAVGLSMTQGLQLERTMLWASARALLQLLAVGSMLAPVLDPDRPIALAWLWVVLMVVIAALTIRHRAPEVPNVLGLAFVAMGTSTAVGLAVL